MSFDALTIAGTLIAVMAGGFLLLVAIRNDSPLTEPRRSSRSPGHG
jgi:hypothetical protein